MFGLTLPAQVQSFSTETVFFIVTLWLLGALLLNGIFSAMPASGVATDPGHPHGGGH